MEQLTERQKIINLALIKIGVKCDLLGFSYLSKAIELVIEQPMLIYDLHNLYEQVAKSCNALSALRVEANIQNAITTTYNYKGFKGLNELYGMEIMLPHYKPTTAEIIKLIAEYYEMGLYRNAL